MSGNEPEPTPVDIAGHDPTGLDLARQLTAGLEGGVVQPRKKKKRQKRPKPSNNDLEPIAAALENVIKDEGWERDMAIQAVFGRWASIVGPDVAQHSKPEHLAGRVLTVRADSTAWATSLRTMAGQLVARLNTELGQTEVDAVKILGPDAPSWKHGRRSVRDGRGPRDTYG